MPLPASTGALLPRHNGCMILVHGGVGPVAPDRLERVRNGLHARRLITYAELFTSLAAAISKSGKVVFDFAVLDG